MASYAIPNGQVKASSEWDPNHAAIQGRLHYLPPPGKQGGWSAKYNKANQWLQIDLGALFRVTAVATQGRSNYNQWVTKYKLQYSDNGATFTYYMETGQNVAKVTQTACIEINHTNLILSLFWSNFIWTEPNCLPRILLSSCLLSVKLCISFSCIFYI